MQGNPKINGQEKKKKKKLIRGEEDKIGNRLPVT
jgi:hypothetical protein